MLINIGIGPDITRVTAASSSKGVASSLAKGQNNRGPQNDSSTSEGPNAEAVPRPKTSEKLPPGTPLRQMDTGVRSKIPPADRESIDGVGANGSVTSTYKPSTTECHLADNEDMLALFPELSARLASLKQKEDALASKKRKFEMDQQVSETQTA